MLKIQWHSKMHYLCVFLDTKKPDGLQKNERQQQQRTGEGASYILAHPAICFLKQIN